MGKWAAEVILAYNKPSWIAAIEEHDPTEEMNWEDMLEYMVDEEWKLTNTARRTGGSTLRQSIGKCGEGKGEQMSITDKLREWIGSLYTPNSAELKSEGLSIADRIDEDYQKAIRELNNLASASVLLPVDADGVPIRIGDVMDGINKYEPHKKVTGTVGTIHFHLAGDSKIEASVGVRVLTGHGNSYYTTYIDPHASVYRHHHEQTVEDVLREFTHAILNQKAEYREQNIAEYAAKLRLADWKEQ